MSRRLLLLTGHFEAQFIRSQMVPPDGVADHVPTLDAVVEALDRSVENTTLLAFCTAVIVPRRVLARLPVPSYNVHPGPPDFPGRHPESWGAYRGCTRFGATFHEMAPRVDEGAIVDTQMIDVAPGSGQLEFGRQALRAALVLLARWIPRLLDGDGRLPPGGAAWSGHKTTHAELDAMTRLSPDVSRQEFERRRRAFAEVPGSRLSVLLHGCEFVHITPEPSQPA
jgi:methionyl-tRNA formyltransferase